MRGKRCEIYRDAVPLRSGDANDFALSTSFIPNSVDTAVSLRIVASDGQIYDTTAGSYYNAMFVRFDKRLWHGLQLGANYTWSSLMSDNDEALNVGNLSDSSPPIPQDYRNLRPEWSRSAFDRPQRFVAFYSYRTPTIESQFARRIVSASSKFESLCSIRPEEHS